MATAKVATKDTSLCETAQMFRDNGIEVDNWFEGRQGPVHLVAFYGDEDAGIKAVEVAKTIGLYPYMLRHVRKLEDDKVKDPYWELIFFYVPPSDPAPYGSRDESAQKV